jgi:23S rRNA (uracil1939-C5)-methyltransferase
MPKDKKRKLPGDAGYLTPTQLRNSRKRRAKQSTENVVGADPSQRYIRNPTKAPIIQKAIHFFKDANMNFPIVFGPTKGWRTVAKLAVRTVHNQLTLGLFEPNSHALVPVVDCPAHHPSINQAMVQIQTVARSCNAVQAFNESTGQGDLKYVCINVDRQTANVQVTLVWSHDPAKLQQQDLIQRLIHTLGDSLHSLWTHVNASGKHDNAIYSHIGEWRREHGPEHIVEYFNHELLPRVPLHFSPHVFRQANGAAFATIVAQIRARLLQKRKQRMQSSSKQQQPVHSVELYGGVGTIGLHVADLCDTFVSSDENPHNQNCFQASVETMKSTKSIITYESKNAERMVAAEALKDADWVIVDPPRKGLDTSVVQALCDESCPTVLVYVSCGFDAFTRDYKSLISDGKWTIAHAEGHVLFPGSDAIETLAFFDRKRRST